MRRNRSSSCASSRGTVQVAGELAGDAAASRRSAPWGQSNRWPRTLPQSEQATGVSPTFRQFASRPAIYLRRVLVFFGATLAGFFGFSEAETRFAIAFTF